MSSAKRQLEHLDFPEEDAERNPAAGGTEYDPRTALKQQVAERLAAHRSRRGQQASVTSTRIAEPAARPKRATHIAAAVAERYAQTQSYRDFLAAEAERAIDAANAAAQVAARSAQAIVVAQQQLLDELNLWNDVSDPETWPLNPQPAAPTPSASNPAHSSIETSTETKTVAAGLTVRLYEDTGLRHAATPPAAVPAYTRSAVAASPLDQEESFALDDEIAFRQSPVFEEPAGPPIGIPANLIQFPRQLVAPRKARPRVAEGPLREEADTTPAAAQLRIFEVEPTQIATAPAPGVETSLPEWSSIHLDASPVAAPVEQEETVLQLPLQVAALNLRLMSALVDGCILGVAFVAAVSAFTLRATELPSLPIAAIAAAGTLLVLFVLYHLLFFTLADATPGMRYARIGLCTLSDENPSRAQMRARTWAILIAALPIGLGFLWASLDEDRLGWHDRISGMYQRSY